MLKDIKTRLSTLLRYDLRIFFNKYISSLSFSDKYEGPPYEHSIYVNCMKYKCVD